MSAIARRAAAPMVIAAALAVLAPVTATAQASTRPSAGTTGVPSGTKLKTVGPGGTIKASNGAKLTMSPAGVLSISRSNLTISGYDIKGIVVITGSHVTITRSVIRGMSLGAITTQAASTGNTALYTSNYAKGARANTISHSTIRPDARYSDANGTTTIDPRWIGLAGGGFTADHDNISGAVDLIQTTGSDVTVSASYLHDNTQYAAGKDPWLQVYNNGRYKNDPSHSDAWQVEGGSDLALKGSNVVRGPWSAVQATENFAKTDRVTITGNWLSGGTCTVNLHDNPGRGPITGVSITRNVFEGTNRGSTLPGCHVIAQTTTRATATVDGNTSTDGYAANVIKNGGADTP